MLTHESLLKTIHYDPLTGLCTWLTNNNRHNAGELAGSWSYEGGYKRCRIYIEGKQYKRARLAIFYTDGVMPIDMVDHINGDTADDSRNNLRQVSNTENQYNRRNPKISGNNKYIGVSLYSRTGKYQAKIRVSGVDKHLGYHDTPEEASKAYREAKAEFHGIIL